MLESRNQVFLSLFFLQTPCLFVAGRLAFEMEATQAARILPPRLAQCPCCRYVVTGRCPCEATAALRYVCGKIKGAGTGTPCDTYLATDPLQCSYVTVWFKSTAVVFAGFF